MTALKISNLSKHYGNSKALDNVSFELPKGVIGGLVGPNGAGKTTLFSAVAQFIQPTHGSIEIFGHSMDQTKQLNGLLGILPQDARFPKNMPLRNLFNWYGRLMGLTAKQAKIETERVAEAVSLRHALNGASSQLSHGMNKRMSLAQAIIGKPKLIILDEPTAGLDPAIAFQIRELIRGLKEEHTVLVSSHNLDEISDICDHITILKKGRLVETGDINRSLTTNSSFSMNFKLKTIPNKEFIAQLNQAAIIQSSQFNEKSKKLQCVIDNQGQSETHYLVQVLQLLEQHKIEVNNIQLGETLEERFLEVTQ